MFRLSAILSLAALPAMADAPRVVVDIAPVHALVTQVMEGVATPDLLLSQDANPHAVQLRPSQARMLSQADLIVWVGPELSPWLEPAIEGLSEADQIILMDDPATTLREFQLPVGAERDTDLPQEGHAGETPAEQAQAAHAHGSEDPHIWLSIDNARAWVSVFADKLGELDPEHAATYSTNATSAAARLDSLATRIEDRLAPFKGAEIVTFHASLGYFADRFGLEIAGSVRPGDAASPSAAALQALEQIVASHDVSCAFAEPGFDSALLESISNDTGLRIGMLDPTGALQQPGPDHYEATLMSAADAIADCLEAD